MGNVTKVRSKRKKYGTLCTFGGRVSQLVKTQGNPRGQTPPTPLFY